MFFAARTFSPVRGELKTLSPHPKISQGITDVKKKSFRSIRPKTGMALSFLPRCCLVAVRLFSTDFRLVIEK